MTCKGIYRDALRFSEPILRLRDSANNPKGAAEQWIKQTVPRFAGLVISSNNTIESAALHYLTAGRKELTVSLSKCFRLNELAWQVLPSCKHAAICDLQLQGSSLEHQCMDGLRSLALTNSSFCARTFGVLLDDLPEDIAFLGLGGCFGLFKNEDPRNIVPQLGPPVETAPPASSPPLSKAKAKTFGASATPLIIETTFLSESDLEKIRSRFPSSTRYVDLVRDSEETIIGVLESSINATMKRAIATCSDGRNRTPLHIACELGDVARVRFLLRFFGARVDLKDVKGATPMYRAAEHGHVECLRVIFESLRGKYMGTSCLA
jgi:Ankyrin repeats (3 copies)